MDRIAIISDIHGNVPALEAVLSDIKNRNITRIICLGDIAGKGPSSDIVVDMIKENCEVVVKGNWDYFMTDVEDNETILWHQTKLGKERLSYLKTLPTYAQFFMSGRLVRLCHAAPEDVFHRVPSHASNEEKKKLFIDPRGEGNESDVVGYGDIHGAYINNFDGKILFNVGSIGNPLDMPQSSYGILEGEYDDRTSSSLSVSLVRVPYDIEESIRQAIDSKMPDLEAYINELRTARYRGRNKKF